MKTKIEKFGHTFEFDHELPDLDEALGLPSSPEAKEQRKEKSWEVHLSGESGKISKVLEEVIHQADSIEEALYLVYAVTKIEAKMDAVNPLAILTAMISQPSTETEN